MPDYAITPIRLTAELDATIAAVAKRLGKSKQDTMRLCMELGAKWIEANGYDPTREISAAPIIEELQKLLTLATDKLVDVLNRDSKSARK